MTAPLAFIDLQAQRERLGAPLDRAIAAAVAGGQWILGPPVRQLEEELAAFAGAKHCVSCANGTDALLLILKAWNIGPGDAVFVPAFTFVATAEVVVLAGATPVFVDVRADTYNMDIDSLAAAVAMVRREGRLRPRAVIPVDLFGQPADYDALEPLCAREDLLMLCDTAQAFGATYRGRRTGSIGNAAATSFFPAKPLGCYGDGGACFTDDDGLAAILRSVRMHGEGEARYEHPRVGFNSRLDTIQAAILLEKLKIFPDEIAARERVARRYSERLGNAVRGPYLLPDVQSVWAQYTIEVEDRAALRARLNADGIPSAVYYPIPLNAQPAYRDFPSVPTPVSKKLSGRVVSLPMHPYLDEAAQDRIVAAVLAD